MRRLSLAAAACVAALTLAPAARADVPQAWVSAAVAAAQSYWGNTVPPAVCQQAPAVTQVPLVGKGGQAFSDCSIQIDSSEAWTPYNFCTILVHEWGHLTLGFAYFAAQDPADPAHSLDTTGQDAVMQESQSIYSLQIPQCEQAAAVLEPAPAIPATLPDGSAGPGQAPAAATPQVRVVVLHYHARRRCHHRGGRRRCGIKHRARHAEKIVKTP